MSLEGQQIDRYRIVRLLGSGGMGDVYLAEDARIEQQVALKVIRAEVSPYPDAQATREAARLFQREARAIVKLDHPHILPLYDYGEERIGNMTIIYLVMPYRREGSLSDWLRQRGQAGLLSPQEVAHFVSQAASALQHAHDRQIIHQDVKASNFLLRSRHETPTRPDVLLADFGIARFSTATTSASQSIRGTPTSMAPEQWEGHPVPATDQYALAVMAYELLTGRPPFQGAPGPLMYQHLTVPPPPPSSLNSRLSGELDTVLLHALAKRPEQRFASITTFANAFQQAAQAIPGTEASPLKAAATSLPSTRDIQATLAISPTEAQTGTTRTLTLPGGRQVRVPVPAGALDGQVLRLEGQGDISPAGGPAGALILTLLVKAAEEPPPFTPTSATGTEKTILTVNPEVAAPSAPIISNIGQQPGIGRTARPEMSTPPHLAISPTEAATPASQVSLPVQPPSIVAAQRQSLVADRSQDTSRPTRRGISRRAVIVGLSLTGLAVAGGITSWWVLSPHPLYTYHGHAYPVYTVVWSPDGKRIASGGADSTVQVWDATNGGNVYTYRGHSGTVFVVAWSPDGRRIASGSYDGTVQVWVAKL